MKLIIDCIEAIAHEPDRLGGDHGADCSMKVKKNNSLE
jgi:hypothetical protein